MKKIKLAVMVLLALLCLSAAGCLFSFVYGQFKDLSRQNRLKTFRDYERQEAAAQALESEYREWQTLPEAMQKFLKDNVLSMDEFAAFRRDLDSRLAANGLQPKRIDFTFGNSQDGIKKVLVKFPVEGSYRSLKKFIFDMESRSKMYFFRNVELSANANMVKGFFMLEVYLGE
jgi:Tfp pilus assembly protein PilO